ncbi:MAG TPA: HAMP domain-containing sensor histidine kinase [Solirubrobacteraceae bacterium]|nr:HAMP domain-containing sensor histidine kinase [Solirubrobacteraceae bacterium]
MTLRARFSAIAGVAVAAAILVVALVVYFAVRSELFGQIDQTLNDRARPFVERPSGGAPDGGRRFGGRPDGGPPPGGPPAGPRPPVLPGPYGADPGRRPGPPDGRGRGRPSGPSDPGGPLGVAAAGSLSPYGGAAGHLQFVSPAGRVSAPPDESGSPLIPASAAARAIAARGSGRDVSDVHVGGVHVRVLTVGRPGGGAVQTARPLSEVDRELGRIVLILVLVGVGGSVLAALLGAFVGRAALAPINRFTRRTENLTSDLDLSERLEVVGRDELTRLARSFNTTLDALEGSVAAQRQLVADASHELRTPIASLRANIQTLEDAERLPESELAKLREDIVSELDELTALVGDVVELARGTKRGAAQDFVRIDEVVAAAVRRAERRAPELTFEVDLVSVVVRGDPERISRAVSNVIDNARKWSPPDGTVEVGLRDGVLSVRDHGPGFDEADLPHVFDRFFRAPGARTMEGSGLGLAIVRQAAEAHGGFARASNARGGGALLELSFGAVLEGESEPERAEPDQQPISRPPE